MSIVTIKDMLTDIEEAREIPARRGGLDLSSWEEDFIDSITEQINECGSLTQKQTDVVRKIWDRI